MFRWGWVKVIALISLPINAWLGVFYYLHWQRKKAFMFYRSEAYFKEVTALRLRHVHDIIAIKEGQRLNYPFPYRSVLLGTYPPLNRGSPVLFLNISWIAKHEIWEQIITDILNTSPDLYLVLMYYPETEIKEGRVVLNLSPLYELMRRFNHPRLSAVAGEWVFTLFGNHVQGTLLILCDGNGTIRAIEPYPQLKISPYWEEEVADWRPKLHQAIKKVLDKFFPKKQER